MNNAIEKNLAKADPLLHKIILQVAKPQIISTTNVFHDLMSCIIEQQIHYRSTKKIFHKMLLTAGLEQLTPENFHQFEEKSFSTIKFSAAKYETMLRVLDYWQTNTINWQLLSDEEVRLKLSSIKGIGHWTIDMILLYTLERASVFPVDDYHLKKKMIALYNLDPKVKLKARMIEISEKWKSHQSLATLYILARKIG